MNRKLQVHHVINLGAVLERFTYPLSRDHEVILKNIKFAIATFLGIGFAKEVAKLEILKSEIEQAYGNRDTDQKFEWDVIHTGKYLSTLLKTREEAFNRMQNELSSREVLILHSDSTIESLKVMADAIKDPRELVVLKETIRCLEAGAYRAAYIMGWNLTYEHFRRWIFRSKKSRLPAFNAVLIQKQYVKANRPPVVQYEDFEPLPESLVIEVASQAKLVTKQTRQILDAGLNDRNHFAHPSSRDATLITASGFVANLVLNILSDPYFA